MKNLFISIGGIDGTGKTSLVERLCNNPCFVLAPRKHTYFAKKLREEGLPSNHPSVGDAYFNQLKEVQDIFIKNNLSDKTVIVDRWTADQVACNKLHGSYSGSYPELLMPDIAILLTAKDDLRRLRLVRRSELSPNDEISLKSGAQEEYIDAHCEIYGSNKIIQIDTTEKSLDEVYYLALKEINNKNK